MSMRWELNFASLKVGIVRAAAGELLTFATPPTLTPMSTCFAFFRQSVKYKQLDQGARPCLAVHNCIIGDPCSRKLG